MRFAFNLEFNGAITGNWFFTDYPNESSASSSSLIFDKNHEDDPIVLCNDFINSNPSVLEEAY